MASSLAWHDHADMLVTMTEEKLVVWQAVQAAFNDPDQIAVTRDAIDLGSAAKGSKVAYFTDNRCLVIRGDGAAVTIPVSQYSVLLHRFVQAHEWPKALRLCRHVADQALWASIAVTALAANELDTALCAYAAL